MSENNRMEWTYLDRSEWRFSPDEPDAIQWSDDYTGFRCRIQRNHSGALCGYVGFPEHHPLFGLDYRDSLRMPDGWEDSKLIGDDRVGIVDALLHACREDKANVSVGVYFDAHGGLTYSDSTGDSAETILSDHPDVDMDRLTAYLENLKREPWKVGAWVLPDGGHERSWWLGFDCSHYGDIYPGDRYGFNEGYYKDRGYVEAQVTSLAAQCKRLVEMIEDGTTEIVKREESE